jgi:hypothetical protein
MKKILLVLSAVIFAAFQLGAQENLINGGSFDTDTVYPGSGGANNLFGTWTDAGGSGVVEGGICKIFPGTPNTTDVWHMQLEQKGLALENGKAYIISFKAWSTAERPIQVTLEDPNNGYHLVGVSTDENTVIDASDNLHNSKWNVDLTTTPTVYTLHVTVDRLTDNSIVKFAFLMSQTADSVFIDDVQMIVDRTAISEISKSEFKVFPNPAKNILYVNSQAGAEVKIYNIAGSLVMSKITSSANEKLNISNLPSGLYLIKVNNYTQKFIIK